MPTEFVKYIRRVEAKARTLYIINRDRDHDPAWDGLTPLQKHLWIQQVKREGLVPEPERTNNDAK